MEDKTPKYLEIVDWVNGQIEAGGVPLWTYSICRPLGVCSGGPVSFSLNTNQKARAHLFSVLPISFNAPANKMKWA